MKPVYRMSEAGSCPRVLGANRLGYERLPDSEDSRILLNHASEFEALAANQIMNEGYGLEPPSLCQVCKERYGVAVVPSEARKLLSRFDQTSKHYKVVIGPD